MRQIIFHKLGLWFIATIILVGCSPVFSGLVIKDRLLEWSDFKGKPDPKSPYDAFTFYNVQYEYYDVRFEYNRAYFNFNVKALFGDKSWVLPSAKNDYELLSHEQGHYDLARAFARELRKRFRENEFYRNNFKSQIENLFYRLNTKYEELQKKYDNETNHGVNKTQQLTWKNRIRQMMEENL